jgi:hypothetical protein
VLSKGFDINRPWQNIFCVFTHRWWYNHFFWLARAEVVLFTAGLEDYAKPILDELDRRYGAPLQYRLYRPATTTCSAYPCLKVSSPPACTLLTLLARSRLSHRPKCCPYRPQCTSLSICRSYIPPLLMHDCGCQAAEAPS